MNSTLSIRTVRCLLVWLAALSTAASAGPEDSRSGDSAPAVDWIHPRVEGYGKVVRLPTAVDQPRDGSRVLIDLTTATPPGELNPGLVKVARFVNIFAGAGKSAAEIELHVVLHGGATGLAVREEQRNAAREDPNKKLMRELHSAGVRFFVCGQSLSHSGYLMSQADETVAVAVSAFTLLINRTQDGFAVVRLD